MAQVRSLLEFLIVWPTSLSHPVGSMHRKHRPEKEEKLTHLFPPNRYSMVRSPFLYIWTPCGKFLIFPFFILPFRKVFIPRSSVNDQFRKATSPSGSPLSFPPSRPQSPPPGPNPPSAFAPLKPDPTLPKRQESAPVILLLPFPKVVVFLYSY